MDIELLEVSNGMGYYSVEVRAKVEGKTKYFDIRVKMDKLTLSIEQVGIAVNKNRNYKFISSMNNKYRYYRNDERLNKVREDIKEAVPKEILLFALDKVASLIKVDNDWILS